MLKENNGTYEEMDITIEEVHAAISLMDVKSAPSPTEKNRWHYDFQGRRYHVPSACTISSANVGIKAVSQKDSNWTLK